ncbi:MAG: AraC family transcriptional regulator [Gemmatimonadales bacterium]
MLAAHGDSNLGKIAGALSQALARRERDGVSAATTATGVASGQGWSVADVICTAGPTDRAFEERHGRMSIAITLAGTFQYRSGRGRALMTPGALLLGNAGECFECGHEHAAGDRCIAFRYQPELFDRIAADVGLKPNHRRFRTPRLPPTKRIALVAARAAAGIDAPESLSWEELAVELAATAVRDSAAATLTTPAVTSSATARVTESVRRIEACPAAPWRLQQLAAEAGQSPYHFLRIFQQVAGVTPHQFILRARLREAARQLRADDTRVIEIAFSAGFGDLSNFNKSFRAEFGVTPRAWRGARGR